MNFFIKVKRYLKYRWFRIKDNLRYKSFGKKSKIFRPLHISGKSRISIGNNVYVYKGARIQTIANWAGNGKFGELYIGNGTSIEQFCHIVAADRIIIGDECVFSAFVYISDCSHQFTPGVRIMDTELICKPVTIGKHCFIGIGSYILPGVNLGNNVVIGANSVVTSDIPDDCMAVGSPAKVIKKWDYSQNCFVNI